MRLTSFLIGIVMSTPAACSFAETHVFSVYDLVPVSSPEVNVVPVEVGAILSDVTSVSVRVLGTGGGGTFDCPQSAPGVWYDLEILILFGGRSFRVLTADQVAFDETVAEVDWLEHPDYPIGGSAELSLGVSTGPGLIAAFIDCEAVEVALPVIDQVEVTVVAGTVVGNAGLSWGALKSRFY